MALARPCLAPSGGARSSTRRAGDCPDDSPIAVGYADASLAWLTYRGRLVPFYLLVAIALLLRVKLRTHVWSRRLAAGRDANAELADETGR